LLALRHAGEEKRSPGAVVLAHILLRSELLDSLKELDKWPERVKMMQENWIGRSKKCAYSFPVEGIDASIEVFTTRIDTIYGATFLSLAPEHPWWRRWRAALRTATTSGSSSKN
jgi:leucyl-tRNA synthetase